MTDIIIYKGDTVEFTCVATGVDISSWKIRAEIKDSSNILKKATTNSGGSDDQIQITDAVNGEFSVKIEEGDTTDFANSGYMEIEMESPTGKIYTVFQTAIELKPEFIKWSTP